MMFSCRLWGGPKHYYCTFCSLPIVILLRIVVGPSFSSYLGSHFLSLSMSCWNLVSFLNHFGFWRRCGKTKNNTSMTVKNDNHNPQSQKITHSNHKKRTTKCQHRHLSYLRISRLCCANHHIRIIFSTESVELFVLRCSYGL